MSGLFAIPVVAFVGVAVGVFAVSFAVCRYYTDKHESEPLPFWTAVIGLSLPLFCLLLIPVDIYNVSSGESYDVIEARAQILKYVYYSLYAAILAFMFGFIPFAYFYYEEEDENVSVAKKALGGCKYTAFLLVIVVVLLVIGLIIFFTDKSKPPSDVNSENGKKWIEQIASKNESNALETSISFAVAALTLLGYVVWLTYTAYGLSALPIRLIRGRKHLGEESQSVADKLRDAREKKGLLNSKYAGRGEAPGARRGDKSAMSRRDRSAYEKLERQERILSRHSNRLGSQNTGWRKILVAVKPFTFIFGIVFILVSLLLVVSMAITNFVKATQAGWCQGKCGFLLAYQEFYNPLDALLTIITPYFPADYVVVLLVVAYVFFATLSGIVGLGIRFLWMTLYKLQYRSTAPQGLLMAAAYLMLAVLALNVELLTLAPQYSTWGSQHWVNVSDDNKTMACSFHAPQASGNTTNGCVMTEIGMFVSEISVRMSFFGAAFFYGTFGFLVMFLFGIILALFKAKGTNLVTRDDDSDSDEDW